MKKVSGILFFVLTGTLLFGSAKGARAVAGGSSAIAAFRDATGDMLRSDGNGPYRNGSADCVVSQVFGGGLYLLRTIMQSCTTSQRYIVLDFSNVVSLSPPFKCAVPVTDPDDSGHSLNACGPNSTIPDVKLNASTLFRKSASTTTLSLFFNFHADFHEIDFELDFLNPICITGKGVMEEGATCPGNLAGNDQAELYQINEAGHKVSVGIYNMPFQLTVTQP